MKNKGEFKGYKKREVLAKKWRDLGDERVCHNVVKLWKEREKRRSLKEEKADGVGDGAA